MTETMTDQAEALARIEALQAAITALEKQVGKAGREQLKANALAETQLAQLSAALIALRSADERREAELAALHERQRAALAEARLAVVRGMLPAIDGLDEAMRSGQHMLAQQPATLSADDLLSQLLQLPIEVPAAPPSGPRADLAAWLTGLEFVRRRMLDALAAEGVYPIESLGQPFDPQLHLAVEVVPAGATPPDHVAQEFRRGYLVGNQVLRHAEVAVAAER
jgi:molecular chaperone GrpE (heat shock protein)